MTHEDTVAKLKEAARLLREVADGGCFFDDDYPFTDWKRGRSTAYVDSAYWATVSASNFLEMDAGKP